MLPSQPHRTSSAFSWLGFALALVVFLFVAFVDILTISAMANGAIGDFDTDHALFILYAILIVVGGIFWLLALIFCVIGLVVAIKHFTPKWISIIGIILCCVSLPAVFLPPFIGWTAMPEPIILPPHPQTSSTPEKTDIRIVINESGILECYDLTSEGDSTSIAIDSGCANLATHISEWMQSRGLTRDATVSIYVDPRAGYQSMVNVIDVMHLLSISRFSICDQP